MCAQFHFKQINRNLSVNLENTHIKKKKGISKIDENVD